MNDIIAKLTGQLCSYLQASSAGQTGTRITVCRPGMSFLDLFKPRIDVYLMEVNENPSQQNEFIPPAGNGQVPPVGLDLRYLITSTHAGTVPQELLQASVKAMAAKPVFDPTAGNTPASNVHLSLVRTDIEELEKVWSMMGARHAPSLIYRATGLVV